MEAHIQVLIAEDDPHVRGLVRDVITDPGHSTTCVASGDEALAYYAEHGADGQCQSAIATERGRAGKQHRCSGSTGSNTGGSAGNSGSSGNSVSNPPANH